MTNRDEIYNSYKAKFSEIEIGNDDIIRKYTSVEEEYNFIKKGVAVRDLSNYSKIFIHGKDSESLLKRLTTNKIYDLKVLEWAKTLFVNNDGNIIDRTLLYKFEDYYLLVGSNTEDRKLIKWITRFVIDEDIVLENSVDNYSLFEIMGSQATSYMAMILGDKYNELSEKNILRVQVEDFFVHGIKLKDVGNIDKYVILVDSKNAIRALEIMNERKSVFDFGMVGEDAYNVFRIENGIPIAPNELNDNVNPIEVNLLDEVYIDKKNYIGCEELSESNNELGKLVRIVIKGRINFEDNNISIVNSSGDEIGIITSVSNTTISPNPIALGFIDSNVKLNGENYFALSENQKTEIEIFNL
jgi:glycine cleavage system aminomethyltransferase T